MVGRARQADADVSGRLTAALAEFGLGRDALQERLGGRSWKVLYSGLPHVLQLSSTDLRDLGSGTSARSLTQLFFSAAAIVIRQQPRNAKADQVVLAYRIVSNYWRLWGDDLCAG